jgi:hypothetical protein
MIKHIKLGLFSYRKQKVPDYALIQGLENICKQLVKNFEDVL